MYCLRDPIHSKPQENFLSDQYTSIRYVFMNLEKQCATTPCLYLPIKTILHTDYTWIICVIGTSDLYYL